MYNGINLIQFLQLLLNYWVLEYEHLSIFLGTMQSPSEEGYLLAHKPKNVMSTLLLPKSEE